MNNDNDKRVTGREGETEFSQPSCFGHPGELAKLVGGH